MAVPLWTGNLEANAVRGRVFAQAPSGETMVSDKEYALPADGDWFELPVVPAPHCSCYRIELSAPKGLVGWYRAADGSLAYAIWRYAEANPGTQSVATGNRSIAAAQTVAFAAESPFFGVRLNLAAATNNIAFLARLRRELPGTGWSPVISEQTITPAAETKTTFWCESIQNV